MTEHTLYGSKRVGVIKQNIDLQQSISTGNGLITKSWDRTRGNKNYELANHLGNVINGVSDLKIRVGISVNNTIVFSYYEADVRFASDYYPFGMQMKERTFAAQEYTYGFNGIEDASEIGEGHNTTFYREQDTRIGRWWSIDPKNREFESPYVMIGNNPIWYSDALGDTIRTGSNHADAVYKYANKQKDILRDEIDNLTIELNEHIKNEEFKEAKTISRLITNKVGMASQFIATVTEIDKMRSARVYFDISSTNKKIGLTTYSGKAKNGIPIISLQFPVNDVRDKNQLVAHELKHGFQFINGQISYNSTGSAGILYDIFDEQEAYQRQAAFAGGTLEYKVSGIRRVHFNALELPNAYDVAALFEDYERMLDLHGDVFNLHLNTLISELSNKAIKFLTNDDETYNFLKNSDYSLKHLIKARKGIYYE